MKTTSVLSIALFLPLSLSLNAQRTATAILQDARLAAVEHLGANQVQLSSMKVVENIGEIAVVSSKNVGTVFVSRTENANRVLGITPTPYVAADSLPCGLKLWLEAANHHILSSEPINTVAATMASDVEPFLTTTWSQEDPYNSLCPKSGTKRCLTGCVATALGQMMNYFEYPARGKGMASYYVTSGSSTSSKLGVISSTYDWQNMADNLTSASATETKAVATLLRDCGYATSMTYDTDGSGTSDYYVPSALATNFSYDSLSVNYLQREYTSDEEWYTTIYTELAAKRPVMLSGQSASEGGHAFVLDGMSADGMVHINWGWGGTMNGYFDPDVMTSSADFTLSQSIVYGLNPQTTPSNPTSYPATHIVIDEPALTGDNGQLSLTGLVMNLDWRDFVGDIIYVVESQTDTSNVYALYFLQAPEGEPTDDDILPAASGWQFTSSSPLTINDYLVEDETSTFTFPAGDYVVYMLAAGIHEDEYYYIPTNGGNAWKESFTVASDGSITFTTSTAIDRVITDNATTTSDRIYDLSGRLASKSTKGIVIVNGKKLLRNRK